VEEGTALLSRAMSLSSSEDANASLIARTNLAAARKAYALQIFEECERFATASLEAAKVVGDREGIVEAFLLRASARRGMRRLAEARADIDAALDRCRGLARGPLSARIALHSSTIDADSGELAHAEELCDAVIGEGTSASGLALVADAYAAKAFCRALGGDYASARDAAAKALELFVSVGNRIHEAYALLNLGVIERELGNVHESLEHIERSFKIQSPIFPKEELAATCSELSLTYALLGDLERARTLALDCVSVPVSGAGLAWQHLTFFTVWRTLRLTGNEKEAEIVLRRACEAFALHYEMVPEESRERFLAIGLHGYLIEAAERSGIASSIRLPLRSH
jgi:tetratricopeptide (TPR) repeat protein